MKDFFKERRYSSWELAVMFEKDHRSIRRLIHKYKSMLEKLGDLSQPDVSSRERGGQKKEVLLNEAQFTLLSLLCNPTPSIDEYKMAFVESFFIQRNLLLDVLSKEYISHWVQGAPLPPIEGHPSMILFVSYARERGIEIYGEYKDMEAQSFGDIGPLYFFIKRSSILEGLASLPFNALKALNNIAIATLEEGMQRYLSCEEIQSLVESRLLKFVGDVIIPYS